MPHFEATKIIRFNLRIVIRLLTKHFIANLMLANKISQKPFINAGLVNDLDFGMSVPEV